MKKVNFKSFSDSLEKVEYLNMLSRLYFVANNSDCENSEKWMFNKNASDVYCNPIAKIMRDIVANENAIEQFFDGGYEDPNFWVNFYHYSVDNRFYDAGFEFMGTGGGFSSYHYVLENNDYIMISSAENECMVPAKMDEKCTVGLYDSAGESLGVWDCENVSHALHAAKWDVLEHYYDPNFNENKRGQ